MVGHSVLPPFVYYRTDLIKEQRILYEFYGKMGIMTDRERRKRMHAAGELKSFSVQQFYKNAAEVWASSPRLRSKFYLQQAFPAAIAFFEAV